MRSRAILLLSTAALSLLVACSGEETGSTPTSQPASQSSAQGTLELRVTASPPESVTSVLVTLQDVEVNPSGQELAWQSVNAGPAQLELAELAGKEQVLGTTELDPGSYKQVRFKVAKAVFTIFGNIRQAEVLNETVSLEAPFEVERGETTVLTIVFDTERSLAFRPGIGPGFDPVVSIVSRKAGEALAAASPSVPEAESEMPATEGESGAPSLIRVAIPVGDNLQWLNFYVSQGAGYFNDEGLPVDVVVPPNPMATARFMVMGQADLAVLPRPLFLQAIDQGLPVVAFANLFTNDPINVVLQGHVADARGLSASMPMAERIEGLRGLKIGVAQGPLVRLRALLRLGGLDPETDVELVILHGEEQNPAFGDGTIDALYAHTPYLETALVDQGAVMLINQSAGEFDSLSGRQIHMLVTTQDFAARNPEVLAGMTRAIHRGQQLVHSDLRATTEAIRASDIEIQAPQGLQTILTIYEPAIPETPEVSVENALRELEYYPAHLTPPDLSSVDMSRHVNNDFALQALSSAK